jgi:tRNA G18 (ribose-2'-O)-methylase SpoU
MPITDEFSEATRVDTVTHPLALHIRALLSRSDRDALNEMLIDDEENLLQALSAQVNIKYVFSSEPEQLSSQLRQQLPTDVPIVEITYRTGKKIFGNDRRSRLFAIAALPKPMTLNDLTQANQDIVVLDELAISGNMGAIIRTATAFNVGGMVVLNTTPVDIFDRRIIRSSRGYLFKLPVVTASTTAFTEFCQQNQIDILVTSSHATQLINQVIATPKRLAIVFGNEKQGCSAQLLQHANLQAKIPMAAEVESLNVSAAAGIILYARSYLRS